VLSRSRFVIFVFVAIGIVVLLLYMKLPVLLERMAISKLEGMGATEIKLELADVRSNATQLGKFSFVLERNSRRYTVSARDVSVTYVFSVLLTGKLEAVDITEMSVLIEELAGNQVSEQTQIPSSDDWLAMIPFKKLNLEQFNGEWRTKDGKTYHVKVKGTLNRDTEIATARFDIQTENYGTQQLALTLAPEGMSQLQLSDLQAAETPVVYASITSGAWASNEKQLQADVGISIDVHTFNQQLQRWGVSVIPAGTTGRVELQGPLFLPLNNSPSWQPKGTLALQNPEFKNLGKQLMLDTPLALVVNPKQLQWQFGKGGQVALKQGRFGETRIQSAAAKLSTQAGCRYQLDNQEWSCEPFTLALTVPSIQHQKNKLTSDTGKVKLLSLAGSLDSWATSMELDVPNCITTLGKDETAKQIKLDKVHGTVDASNEKIHAKLALVAPGSGATMHVNATHTIKSNAGTARYRLEPVDMQLRPAVFANTYNGWPIKLAFNTGIISVVGDVSWRQGGALSSQQAMLTLQGVGGMHDGVIFSGLDATFDAQGVDKIQIKSRQPLRLANLNVGMPITDMSLQAKAVLPKGGKPIIAIDDLEMNLLGGKMTGKRIELDLARERNPFTMLVTGVDVEELLKLEQKQGLLGSGVIDGELPLVLTSKGVLMQNGKLAARKPGGKLKYHANENIQNMAKSNASMKLLVTTMKDFNYKVLQADANYDTDGLLKMKVRLEGSNPELEGGRPVHINVDIEDNVLQLLRSLRLASDISKKIGEQVQKRQLSR